MTNPVQVSKMQAKSHSKPDELRTPDKTRVEVVHLDGFTMGRMTFQPGWRWSACVKPVAKTERCEHSHVGYAIAGRLKVQLADGTEQMLAAGQSYTIPPGHDAWVEGNEPFVGMELMSAAAYAKPDPAMVRV